MFSSFDVLVEKKRGPERQGKVENRLYKEARDEAKRITFTPLDFKETKFPTVISEKSINIEKIVSAFMTIKLEDVAKFINAMEPDYELNIKYLIWINADAARTKAFRDIWAYASLVTTNVRKLVVQNVDMLDMLKLVRLGGSRKAKEGSPSVVTVVTLNSTFPHLMCHLQLSVREVNYKGVSRFYSNFMAPVLIYSLRSNQKPFINVWLRTMFTLLVETSRFELNEALQKSLIGVLTKQIERCKARCAVLFKSGYFARDDVNDVLSLMAKELDFDYMKEAHQFQKEGSAIAQSITSAYEIPRL
jgi:hypothetical protein